MALQPAAGARDLVPQQVEINQTLTRKLAEVYKLWGYEEIVTPRVERLDTLTAGGAISNEEIVRLVSDDPLGLRPEMTASIARAASTRMAERGRPLRLWACGSTFESKPAANGGSCIEENLQSGVELFGVKEISAELELLSLLIESLSKLELDKKHKPTLLIGHTNLMEQILCPYNSEIRNLIKNYLLNYDRVSIENLKLEQKEIGKLIKLLNTRGSTTTTINLFEEIYGQTDVSKDLRRLFKQMEPIAKLKGVILQLDPTFQPHFELYTGIVFQLVCKGRNAPIVIARGGRYDNLVRVCGATPEHSSGVGFSFAIDSIREETQNNKKFNQDIEGVLVSFGPNRNLEDALIEQRKLHEKGIRAVLELERCKNKEEALNKVQLRNCSEVKWLNG